VKAGLNDREGDVRVDWRKDVDVAREGLANSVVTIQVGAFGARRGRESNSARLTGIRIVEEEYSA